MSALLSRAYEMASLIWEDLGGTADLRGFC